MKYLVIGSGGREHTIAWKLMTENSENEVYVSPGNGGIDSSLRVKLDLKNHKSVIKYCNENKIDLVVVGPEAPLVDGLVDSLTEAGIPAFGPSKKAAELEGSKTFAKEIMESCGVPTASFKPFTQKDAILKEIDLIDKYPIVIKLDGLAAGKGVGIPKTKEEAIDFINENYVDGNKIFIEDFLTGEEASVLGISDGERIFPFISAQDHKRIFDGDKGPNTGGMGAYSPAPVATHEILEKVRTDVLQPVVEEMAKRGIPFKGILYAGMMIDGEDIKVLEFNVRFGDPETQVILPLMDSELGLLMKSSIDGNLKHEDIKFKNKNAITVVMSSGGYPGEYEKNKIISGLDNVSENVTVFHAGTEKDNQDNIITAGGRVLALTSVNDSLLEAKNCVYSEIEKINFDKKFYRKDIAYKAFNR